MTEVRPFKDRSDRFFGREKDLQALQERVQFKGLTALVARPQMGKSWLLTELARRLAYEHNPPFAVGFAESFGQTPDLLSRAVADLYTRWLSDAGMAEQARMVWKQQKANLLGGIAGTVSKIFSEVFGKAAKPVTVAVDEAIEGLIAANETLTSGGLKLPTLQYEQARDLVAGVARIGGRRVTLFLDQWEKTPDARAESHTLDAFLRHLDDWPACHIVMALRPDEPAYGIVESVGKSLPGAAQMRCSDGCGNLRSRIARTRPSASNSPPVSTTRSIMPRRRTTFPAATRCWTISGRSPRRMTKI